jgi:hypothetical protein
MTFVRWLHSACQSWPFWAVIMAIGWAGAIIGHQVIALNLLSVPLQIVAGDELVHGLIAILMVLPFFLNRTPLPKTLFVVVLFLGVLIDLDHAIAAHSIDIDAMRSLPMRPLSHSLLFTLAVASVVSLFYKRSHCMKMAFYLLFLGQASHVLRDSFDGLHARWAFPFHSFLIPSGYGFFFLILISYLHLFIVFTILRKGQEK